MMFSSSRKSLSTSNGSTTTTFMSEKPKQFEVKQVGIESYKEVALSLARAFAEDELAFYFMTTPDDKHRTKEEIWNLHVEICEYIVAAHCYNGLVLTIGENHEGVALWMPPGCNMDDYYVMFRSGMWRLWYKLSPEGRKRYFDEFFTVLHDAKSEVLGDRDHNSWYLVYLGVVPEARGRGYARKLIEHILKRADHDGLPTYLESSAKRNIPIYERFGFVVKKEIAMTRAEKPVVLDIMVREPRQPGLIKKLAQVPATVPARPRKNSLLQSSPTANAFVKRSRDAIASNLRSSRIYDNA